MDSNILDITLLNITRVYSYNNKTITTHHIAIHNDYSEEDVRSIIIVCIGLGMIILMYILHKWSKVDGISGRCCVRRVFVDSVPGGRDTVGTVSIISRTRKDSPPPPYEAPPSYTVALQMENELKLNIV